MDNSGRGPAERLREQSAELAQEIVERHYAATPELAARYGSDGRQRCLEDAAYHLRYLAEAVESNSPVLFVDYIEWAAVVLRGREIPSDDLAENLRHLREVIATRSTADEFAHIAPVIDQGIAQLSRQTRPTSPTPQGPSPRPLTANYVASLLGGDRHAAVRMVHEAVEGGLSIRRLYLQVLQPAQYEIGWLWQINRISVAQEHYATAVTQSIMAQLYPQTLSSTKNGLVMVCACVGGDSHEIGSRMVADLFELEGWDTHFFGASTPPTAIAEQVERQRARLLALSATMTYHLPQVRETIAAVRKGPQAAILVGGRPFNLDPALWQRVGADGYARDAGAALAVAKTIIDRGVQR